MQARELEEGPEVMRGTGAKQRAAATNRRHVAKRAAPSAPQAAPEPPADPQSTDSEDLAEEEADEQDGMRLGYWLPKGLEGDA